MNQVIIQVMLKSKKPLGRPTMRIDTTVLAQLRRDRGFTQLGLAKAVYALADKNFASKASLKNTAQRWEKMGTLDGALAVHLAMVLQTTLSVLTGEHPVSAPSRTKELEALLRARAQEPRHLELQEALKYFQSMKYEDPVKGLSEQLNRDMEVAQLSQSSEDFARLSALTGLERHEMRQPVSHHGLWMFIASGPSGPERQELLSGTSDLSHVMTTEWRDQSGRFPHEDSTITFQEEKPWFKVTWTYMGVKEWARTLRFVRCQATEKGLAWVASTELDRFWLNNLVHSAQAHFSFVTGFDSIQVPADVSKLRMLIVRNPSNQEYLETENRAKPVLMKSHEGRLPEIPCDVLERFTSEGQANSIALNWLCVELWDSIQPYLSEWSLKYWSFRQCEARIDVVLDHIPYRDWSSPNVPPLIGARFSLLLAELMADGSHRLAPWKTASVKTVCETLSKTLCEAQTKAQEVQATG